MVKWSEKSPFARLASSMHHHGYEEAPPRSATRVLSGDGDSPSAMAQHDRSIGLLKVIMQVDTFLAGFLLWAITGTKESEALDPDEQVQVVLQTVTFGVFLSAIVHTAVLMMSTGWKYTLNWYDPIAPGIASAIGLCLLIVTVADAVLLELQPSVNIDDPAYWYIVICGLLLPLGVAGVVVTLQMTILDS